MCGDDYYPVEINYGESLADSLDEDSNHALLLIHSHTFFQKGSINPNCILLYTWSSIGVFCNPILLENIHRSDRMKNIHFNDGVVKVIQKGTLPEYGLVWFNRDGINHIISMVNDTRKLSITYDSSAGEKFILHKDSKQLIFNWRPLGLYFRNARACEILMVGMTNENWEF